MNLSRSAVYYSPAEIGDATLETMQESDRVFTKYPFFGSRQIAAYLHREGIVVGRHRVRRVPRENEPPRSFSEPSSLSKMGLEAIYKRPRTSQPLPQPPIYPYLLRMMVIDRPYQVLLSLTQASFATQRVY